MARSVSVTSVGADRQEHRRFDEANRRECRFRLIAFAALSIAISGWLIVDQKVLMSEASAGERTNAPEAVLAALPLDKQTRFGRWPISFDVGPVHEDVLKSLVVRDGSDERILVARKDVVRGSVLEFDSAGFRYEIDVASVGAGAPNGPAMFNGVRWLMPDAPALD